MKINKSTYLLTIIVLFGFLLRVYNLSNLPSGVFCDEASIGYNAYTIINNGTDENGRKLPLFFLNYGNFFRPGVSIYLTTIPVLIFGLSDFSNRLSAAIAGTATLLIVFFIVKILYKDKTIALLSSFFLAISPWHIHFSRINQEFVYLCLFLCLGLWIFLEGINRKKQNLLFLSSIVFGLGIYTYVISYFIVPLFFLLISIVFRKQIADFKTNKKFIFLIFLIFLIPLISGVQNGKTLSRFTQISNSVKNENYYNVFRKSIYTYQRHFSYSFLFEKGDIQEPGHFITRFSVEGFGQLYLFQLPFIILGLIFSYKKIKQAFYLLIGWLLIYPLGSTAAPFADGGGPFAMRSISGVVPFQIITASGIFYFLTLIKNSFYDKQIKILLIISIILSFCVYIYKYSFEYPLYSSDFWGWQYGPKEIMNFFITNNKNYEELIIFGDFNSPDIFLRYYDPNNLCRNKCILGDFSNLDLNKKQLFAIQADRVFEKNKFKTIKKIKYPNGEIAFYIGEFRKF